MAMSSERIAPERAWLGASIVGLVVLIGGSLAFPRWVYDRFIWQYFWGPVYADAQSAQCAVSDGGSVRLLNSADACQTAIEQGAVVAEPGYTVVSEIGYMVILLFMLVGVLFLLRRLDVGRDRELFFALIPFMFFGGVLRVVEDANDAVPSGFDPLIAYPLNTLIISPIIYFTMFVIVLVALVGSVVPARREWVDSYRSPLTAIGTIVLGATIVYLLWLAIATEYVQLYPQITLITLLVATITTGGIWIGLQRYAPTVNHGTGYIGLAVLWGHAVDGAANVILTNWATALGLPSNYFPKHPVNRAVIDITGQLLPPSITSVIGTSWPFLLIKLIAAVGVIWIFDEAIFEESPRYAVLLLIAILAVGLGPGTRDMVRATFGI
ncbi:DUF63 family protein [Halomicroarcula sp. F13]|uniref:DUF63 family protein n=1 Tax=Haloarcula rubra TaxID=2487747 RepID=A0AAW4PXL6_9EURY|nr:MULTISPECIES: DUF63 family protein [Halobacteria]MBX0324854.1 DUF63 family protein [Halomicroarcula rubra]RDZ53704.1 hypothetical protein C5B91_20720 [Haloferax sp. Atlit-10N]